MDQVESGACVDCPCEPTEGCVLPFDCPGTTIVSRLYVRFVSWVSLDCLIYPVDCYSDGLWRWRGDGVSTEQVSFGNYFGTNVFWEWTHLGGDCRANTTPDNPYNNPPTLAVTCGPPFAASYTGGAYGDLGGMGACGGRMDIYVLQTPPTPGSCDFGDPAYCAGRCMPPAFDVALTFRCAAGAETWVATGTIIPGGGSGLPTERFSWIGTLTLDHPGPNGETVVGAWLDLDSGNCYHLQIATTNCCPVGGLPESFTLGGTVINLCGDFTTNCGPPYTITYPSQAVPADEPIPGCDNFVASAVLTATGAGDPCGEVVRGCHKLSVCSDADLPDRLCVTLTHVVCSPGVGEGTYQGVVERSRCTWSGTAGRVAGTGPAFVGVRLDLVGSHFTAKLSTSRCCAAGDIGVYSTDDSAFHTQVPYTLTCSPFSIIWDQAALANAGDVSCSNLSVKVYVTPVPCATVVEIETEFGTGT